MAENVITVTAEETPGDHLVAAIDDLGRWLQQMAEVGVRVGAEDEDEKAGERVVLRAACSPSLARAAADAGSWACGIALRVRRREQYAAVLDRVGLMSRALAHLAEQAERWVSSLGEGLAAWEVESGNWELISGGELDRDEIARRVMRLDEDQAQDRILDEVLHLIGGVQARVQYDLRRHQVAIADALAHTLAGYAGSV